MARVGLLLLALLVVGVLIASQPASAQDQTQPQQPSAARAGEYSDVSSLAPFTPSANFMSVPGYLRWVTFRDQGTWISYAEARRIVIAQGGQLYHRA